MQKIISCYDRSNNAGVLLFFAHAKGHILLHSIVFISYRYCRLVLPFKLQCQISLDFFFI